MLDGSGNHEGTEGTRPKLFWTVLLAIFLFGPVDFAFVQMKVFDSIWEISCCLVALFFFIEDNSATRSKRAGSASPMKTASKKSEKGAGLVTPHPPAITMGSPSFLSFASTGTFPQSSIARTSVIPSS